MLVGAKQHGVRFFLLPNISEKLGPMFFFLSIVIEKLISDSALTNTARSQKIMFFKHRKLTHITESYSAA